MGGLFDSVVIVPRAGVFGVFWAGLYYLSSVGFCHDPFFVRFIKCCQDLNFWKASAVQYKVAVKFIKKRLYRKSI